jgi:ABC-type sugar transport system ATPase subunit
LLRDLGMELDPRTPVSRLRLSQRQMVEIAKALASGDAKILLMDEPTSSLTSHEVAQLFSLIERLASRGVAIVYITHRLDEVFRIGRQITVLRDGRHITTQPIGDVTVAELVRLMANRDLTEHFPKVRVPRGPALLGVERIGVRGTLSDISFRLHAGEVVGIAGLLGAGRTELARVLAGADRYDEGRLMVDGREVRFSGPADAIDRGIGLLPEDRAQGSSRVRPWPKHGAGTAGGRFGAAPERGHTGGTDRRGAAREGDADSSRARAERR